MKDRTEYYHEYNTRFDVKVRRADRARARYASDPEYRAKRQESVRAARRKAQ